MIYLYAVLLAIGVETPIVAALYRAQWAKMAAVCAITNAVTNLTLNLVFPLWFSDYLVLVVVGEIFVVTTEALIFWAADREHRALKALLVSLLINTLSFAAGLYFFGGGPYLLDAMGRLF